MQSSKIPGKVSTPVIIENPILNSPYREPDRHFRLANTESWEQRFASSLDEIPEVASYKKNDRLGFLTPYTFICAAHNYLPDFIARLDNGPGPRNLHNHIIEVTGEKKKEKEIKVATARDLWVPAVNGHRGYGRWGFLEARDPREIKGMIRASLRLAEAPNGRA